MGIVTKHVKINHEPFKNINLNGATIFDNIKNMNLDSLIINRKCIKDSNAVTSYEIRYITKWDHTYQKITVCLRFTDLDAYFIEKNESKIFNFCFDREQQRKDVETI